MIQIRAIILTHELFPPILGPVMMVFLGFFPPRVIEFGTKGSVRIASTIGCLPLTIDKEPSSLKVGLTYPGSEAI
jgi:hypothetical protein